jgi:hypothetical protein
MRRNTHVRFGGAGRGNRWTERPALRPGPTPYEWLARQFDKAEVGYLRHEISLQRIDDLEAALRLCERFAHKAWPRLLNAFARRVNPLLGRVRAVLSGEHAINGFKNRDLARRFYRRPPHDPDEAHRRCERISRLIVKLRGHGLVAKVPRSRLYRATHHGNRVLTAAIALHDDSYPERYLGAA